MLLVATQQTTFIYLVKLFISDRGHAVVECLEWGGLVRKGYWRVFPTAFMRGIGLVINTDQQRVINNVVLHEESAVLFYDLHNSPFVHVAH